MPIHIEQMTSEVSVMDGEMPLSEAQMKRLADMVAQHIESRQKDAHRQKAATGLRRSAAPPDGIGD